MGVGDSGGGIPAWRGARVALDHDSKDEGVSLAEASPRLHGLGVAGDDVGDLPGLGPEEGVLGQDGALRPRLLKVFEDLGGRRGGELVGGEAGFGAHLNKACARPVSRPWTG